MTLAPIILFTFKRPDHVRYTLESLAKNPEFEKSPLFIYCDGAKNTSEAEQVKSTRELVRAWPHPNKQIIEREQNWGLAKNIIDGVTKTVNEYGRVIVIEDDLVTSPYFLQYMNDGLNIYEKMKDVASIHGYVYPIKELPETFFLRGADCWGWATWKDRWTLFEPDGGKLLSELKRKSLTRRFDFNGAYPFTRMLARQIAGKNDSWAIRWHASVFLKKKFTLYPGISMAQNIGNDGSGTHCLGTDKFSADRAIVPLEVRSIPVKESDEAFLAFGQYLKGVRTGFFARLYRVMRNILVRG